MALPVAYYVNCQADWARNDFAVFSPDGTFYFDPCKRAIVNRAGRVVNGVEHPVGSQSAAATLVKVLGDAFLRSCQAARALARGRETGSACPGAPRETMLGFYAQQLAATARLAPSWVLSYGDELNRVVIAALANPGSDEVIVGMSALVSAGGGRFDVGAWPWLWTWAMNAQASPRARVFAMRAITDILVRRTFKVDAALLKRVEQLRQSVANVDAAKATFGMSDAELAFFVSEANALVATAAQELATAGFDASGLTPLPPPPSTTPPWLIPVLAGGAAAVVLVAGAVALRSRSRGSRPRSRA